ncbi:MAG: glycosyltransferase [Deltaproteobacteria bacterium]|nr:glycosyltransferase [Deltaproteobacteria bacterium]
MDDEQAPLISFVVPCYNYGRYLPDCVRSILGQEGNFSFEVILINDASTDDTASLMGSFSDPRIRRVSHAINMGHAKTMEEGLLLSRGKYVARIDPDDRYRPDFLSLVVPKLEQFADVAAVYGDVALIDDRGEITAEGCDREHHGRDFKGNEFLRLLENNFICAPSLLARREAWIASLPIPEGLAFNDWYFTLMMARKHEFYYVNQVVAEYRVHAANHHHKIVLDKSEESSIFFLLDRIFSEKENKAEIESRKRPARRRIYGTHYLDMATKYFGCRYDTDARRCYLAAIRYWPANAIDFRVIRRLLGTIIGRHTYEWSKSGLTRLLRPVARVLR